jgi:hypothetical protein
MGTTAKTLDPRHDAFVQEIENYALSKGCSFQGNPAYHDRLPSDQSEKLRFDYSAAGLAERLRCDKRIMNHSSGQHMLTEAKTSYRATGPAKYLFEAYQIGIHKAQRDECFYAIRKVCGDELRDCGFRVAKNFGVGQIQEIRIPVLIRRNLGVVSRLNGECRDDSEFYAAAFAEWFPGVPVKLTNKKNVCCGSGDPYAVMDDSFMNQLGDWRVLIDLFANSHKAVSQLSRARRYWSGASRKIGQVQCRFSFAE